MRGFVLSGQYGIAGYLPQLCQQLNEFGMFTMHAWSDPNVYYEAQHITKDDIALIGYSLGANQAPEWARRLNKPVKLVIAIDPSRQSPLTAAGVQICPSNVERAVCFYNPGVWYYGGARLVGDKVTTIQINKYHLAVPMDGVILKQVYEWVKEAAR